MKAHVLKALGTLMFLFILNSSVFAQDPPPPPSGGHGQSGNQTPGGSAPIGNGVYVLLTFATAYGLYKIYQWKRHTKAESI